MIYKQRSSGRHAINQQKYHTTAKYRKWYREYYKRNRDRILNSKGRREKQRAFRRSKHGRRLAANNELIRHYGITIEDKERMWREQEGLCGVCFKPLPEVSKCHTDHNHETNKVRSLVHRHCNLFIGYVEKFPELLLKIKIYLRRHR